MRLFLAALLAILVAGCSGPGPGDGVQVAVPDDFFAVREVGASRGTDPYPFQVHAPAGFAAGLTWTSPVNQFTLTLVEDGRAVESKESVSGTVTMERSLPPGAYRLEVAYDALVLDRYRLQAEFS